VQLLQQLAGVAMAEDRVGREVVGCVHEVSFGGGCFACAADSGFRIADDAVIEVDYASLNQWGKREDDRGRVTAGIGYDAGVADLVAMEFGAAVDGFRLKLRSMFRVGVFEFVDFAVGVVLETPRTTEVDDLDAAFDGLRNPLAGLLVWGG